MQISSNSRTSPNKRLASTSKWLTWLVELWQVPFISAIIAIQVYRLLAERKGPSLRLTSYPYFNYLADAFLHGQLHLRVVPNITRDLSIFDDRYYLYWPPLPAVVLMPFVAVFGISFSDVIATILLGGLNVALVAVLLQQANKRGVVELSALQRGLLVLFFAFGTVHLTLPPYGMVWFVGQLVGFACVALAYIAALRWRGTAAFVLAGLGIAGALLTRNHLVLAGLWPAWFLLREHWSVDWKRLISYTLVGLLPVVGAIILLGVYNWLRFGSPLDNGLEHHRMADQFARDYQRYGAFNLHYLPTNLFYQFIKYPFPIRYESLMGGSLLLLSPVFFAALWAWSSRQHRISSAMLATTILIVAVPILLLMGTGWVQWGPRYTLDFTVPLLLLTAIGIRRWPTWLVAALTLVSIVHYVVGALYLAQFVS